MINSFGRSGFAFSPFLFLVCCLIAGAAAPSLQAQPDTLEHTLLWRIEGNGLTTPSYLFGTFHTQDSRVFDFRDSVLPALLSCDIAAFELQLDSMSTEMLQRLYSPDSVLDLRDYLTEEEVAIFDARIREETGLPGESLRYADPSFLLLIIDQPTELSFEESESDDDSDSDFEDENPLLRSGPFQMPKETFLDAWLFRTAQLEGKRVVGLETIDEQIAVSDTIPLHERIKMLTESITVNVADKLKLAREMVEAYRQEDVDEILRIVSQEDISSGLLFKLLTERNRTMVERIADLTRQGSVFVAVGTAHLPGEEGLIALLRRKGFRVSPVLSERTGVAAAYKRPKRELPWYRLVDTVKGFSVETPIPTVDFPLHLYRQQLTPYQFTVSGHLPEMRYRFITDITTGLTYYITEEEISLEDMLSDDPYVSAQENSFGSQTDNSLHSFLGSRSGMVMRSKDVEADGIAGKEFTGIDTDGDLTRMRVFQRGGELYTFMVSGGTSVIKSKDDSRFLKSIRFTPMPPSDWTERFTFNETISGILPAKPFFDTTRIWSMAARGTAGTYTATSVDPATGIYYIAEQTSLPPGTTFINDSILLREMVEQGIPIDSILSETSTDLPSEPYARRLTEYRIQFASGATMLRRVQLQGGYAWSASVARPSGISDPEGEKRFFAGIAPTAGRPKATGYTQSNYNFRVELAAPQADSTDYNYYSGMKRFEVGEWTGNQSSLVAVETYSPYYESEGEEQFFEGIRQSYSNQGDSIVGERQVSEQGLNWREYTVLAMGENSAAGLRYRERVALHGARLYRLRRFALDPAADLAAADTFFASFKLLTSTPQGDIFARKIDRLLEDLRSSDSATRAAANAALSYYNFQQEDLPKLYAALERDYPPPPNEYDQRTESRLVNTLWFVHDEKSVEALRSLYDRLPAGHETRVNILDALARIRTDESLEVFRTLMMDELPADTYGYSMFSSFYGDLEGIEKLYPDVLDLAGQPNMRATIFDLTNSALDSGRITVKDIDSRQESLRKIGLATIKQYRSSSSPFGEYEAPVYPWEAEIIITLLGKLPAETEVDNILNRTLRDTNLNVKRASAIALLRHGKEVREKWLTEIAADRLERLNLYRNLTEAGLTERFPKEYVSQTLFAESLISENLYMSEEYPPEEIEYVADRMIEWEGKQMRGYLFKFRYQWYDEPDEEKWGPWYPVLCVQPEDINQVNAGQSLALVRINWNEFNPDEIEGQIEELMNQAPTVYGE